jgi:dihydroorotase-like cyclic amidohydrolase
VVKRGMSVGQLTKLLSENPARRIGLWPQKGGLAIGVDADVVLLDPERRWRVDEAALHTPAGWSPYHGRDVVSSIDHVLVRGRDVFKAGQVVGAAGKGSWVRPGTAPSPVGAGVG